MRKKARKPKKRKAVSQQPAAPNPPQQKPANYNDWTIMVYLGGDNNLAEEMVYALKSMELVGSNRGQYEVVAFYDAGVRPATITIRQRDILTEGVPPVGNLLATAEIIQVEEADQKIEDTKQQVERAGEVADKVVEDANEAKTIVIKEVKKKGAAKAQERVQDFSEVFDHIQNFAKANLSEAKELHSAALAAKEGGPLVIESVEESLVEFVCNAIEDHPATHYMLVLSGHGSGTIGDFLSADKRAFGLSIPGMKDALAEVQRRCKRPQFKGKIDILGLDSCLMGMAEVAFEVREQVEYLIGSEGFEANTGWPYDAILNLVRNSPGIEADRLAKGIVRQYLEYYSADYTLADVSTDITALDLAKIDALAEALGRKNGGNKSAGLAVALKAALPLADPKVHAALPAAERSDRETCLDTVVLAHWKAQGFKNEQHIDLYDFCSLLEERFPANNPISQESTKVRAAIREFVLASASCGAAFQYAHGVSIFFPWASIADAANVRELDHYQFLAFTESTGWGDFLNRYVEVTRRPVRPGLGSEHPSALNRREGLFTGKPGKAGTSFSSKAGTSFSSKAGTSFSSKAGTSFSSKAGTSFSSKAGTSFSSKAGTSFSSKAGTSFSSKGELLPKIASMKNPAINWFNQHYERD